jgi:phosphoribosylformylglycinamidine synthase PurS subunit
LKLRVYVTLKKDVLDPQGSAIKNSLHNIGFKSVSDVRQGKVFELNINENDENKSLKETEEMCKKLLANLTIEDFKVEIAE